MGGHVALAVCLHHIGLGRLLHLPGGGGVLRHSPCRGGDRETARHLGTAATLEEKTQTFKISFCYFFQIQWHLLAVTPAVSDSFRCDAIASPTFASFSNLSLFLSSMVLG